MSVNPSFSGSRNLWKLMGAFLFVMCLGLPGTAFSGERVEQIDSATVEIFFLDIGQGDAILVQTIDGKSLLVDTGPPGARKALMERLRVRNVDSLDGLIVTHAHADHMGNANVILDKLKVKTLFDAGYNHSTQTYARFLEQIEIKKSQTSLKYIQPREGLTFPVGKHLKVEVLGPGDPLLQGTRSDPNTNSVIMRLIAGETTLLLTGDAEHETEVRLLQTQGERLRSDVLKVAHHGSRYASGVAFLNKVSAKDAVISCGRNNSYGHPAQETLERLKAQNMSIWVTSKDGDLALRTDGREYTIGPANFQLAQVSASGSSQVQISQTSQINLNSATESELMSLNGIGPSKAKAIVQYRNQNGGFKSIEGLQAVRGIGAKTVQKLRPFLTLGGGSPSANVPAATAAATQDAPKPSVEASGSGALILNTASREDLMSLPGIGPAKAERILDYRNGKPNGFQSIDELTSVKGIGAKTLEKMRPLLRLNP